MLKSKIHGLNVEIILEETAAFKTALDFAQPDDIVIVFFDKAEPLIDIIKNKIAETQSEIKLLEKI